jgi:hypothetical protein
MLDTHLHPGSLIAGSKESERKTVNEVIGRSINKLENYLTVFPLENMSPKFNDTLIGIISDAKRFENRGDLDTPVDLEYVLDNIEQLRNMLPGLKKDVNYY